MSAVGLEPSRLPTDVLAAPSAFSRPPTQPRLQELPFGELNWEDFEKLCVRLAALEGSPEHWQRYGIAGQDQQGIDIYTRVGGSRPFHTYQCKRYEHLQPNQIRQAVQRFMDGVWKPRCSRFVFCVSVSIEPTQIAEEIAQQRTRLNAEGIEFWSWGAVQLAEKLKAHPPIVDDFFGRGWVRAFCGPEAAESLSGRLDGTKLEALRHELRGFYKRIFRQHDPGVPGGARSTAPAPVLQDRYVEPRIRVQDVWTHTESFTDSLDNIRASSLEDLEWTQWAPEPAIPDGPGQFEPSPTDREMKLDDWLDSSKRLLVIGPPGAGKSSLLRFIALDVLSEKPRLLKVARSRPGCIPMWVPFGFWTELYRDRPIEQCSLRACLQVWFASHDAGDLYALVEPALSDGRLLLLVDGIDEWRSADFAGFATQRLLEFIERDSTPLICSSRPYGLDRATSLDPTISTGVLSDLSRTEQQLLAATWLAHWHSPAHDAVGTDVASRARSFMVDLAGRPDLADLACNPMLLVLLTQSWLHLGALPDNAFQAYAHLEDHLHTHHPRLRANAASVHSATPALSNTERLDLIRFLAWKMQKTSSYEATRESMRNLLVEHLGNKGFDATESRAMSDAILGQAADAPALLVNTSATHIAFLHRGLLEYLAARWIVNQGADWQIQTVREHAADPRWSDVILGIIHGARPDERIRLIEEVESTFLSEFYSAAPLQLLAFVAFGSLGLRPQLARRLANTCFNYANRGSSNRMRQFVARAVVRGLRSNRVSRLVRSQLQSWFPSGTSYQRPVYSALGSLQPSNELRTGLLSALNDDDPSAQRAAADAIARAFEGDQTTFDAIAKVISRPIRPTTEAASLYALSQGWPTEPLVEELSYTAVDSPSSTVRLVGHLIRTSRGLHIPNDSTDLVEMIRIHGGSLDYGWKDIALRLLSDQWSEDDLIRDLVRDNVGNNPDRVLWNDDAWTLAATFLGDDEVLRERIIECLSGAESYMLRHEWFWGAAAKQNGDIRLTKAIEYWATTEVHSPKWLYNATRTFRTDAMKELALQRVRRRERAFFWHLSALVTGWSLEDPEVHELTLDLADGDATEASYAAEYIWDIRPEEDARCQLLALLANPECKRRDFVMRAVAKHYDAFSPEDIAAAFFSVDVDPERRRWDGLSTLLSLGVDHPQLFEIVEEEANRRGEMLSSVLRGYGDHPNYRARLIDAAVPGPVLVRRTVVEELDRVSFGMPVETILQGRVGEEESVSRATAARAYAERYGPTDPELPDLLIREATCYGPTYEQRREAAFCGLVELRRLDALKDQRETIGEPRPIRLGLLRGPNINPVATRSLARAWDYVLQVFPEDLMDRLDIRPDSQEDELESLAAIADWIPADTPLARHVVDLVEATGNPSIPRIIGFMSRTIPGSDYLLDQCLRVLGVRGGSSSNEVTVQARAAEILASQFASEEVLDEILRSTGDSFPPPGVLVAICKGWPDHDWLTRTYERAVAEEAHSNDLGVVELRCARAPANHIEMEVHGLVKTREPLNRDLRRSLLPALIRRTQRDNEVAERMAGLMTAKDANLSLQMAGARVYAAARGPSSEIREWASSLLLQATSVRLWPVAFDVMTGRVRCVQDLVWDLLGTAP